MPTGKKSPLNAMISNLRAALKALEALQASGVNLPESKIKEPKKRKFNGTHWTQQAKNKTKLKRVLGQARTAMSNMRKEADKG